MAEKNIKASTKTTNKTSTKSTAKDVKKTASKDIKKVEKKHEVKDVKKEKNIYHVSQNKEARTINYKLWRVRLQGSDKTIQFFDTQEEAIAYAKKVAANNDGQVVIHKIKGQIRKSKY